MGITVMLSCPSSAYEATSEDTSLPPWLSQFPWELHKPHLLPYPILVLPISYSEAEPTSIWFTFVFPVPCPW